MTSYTDYAEYLDKFVKDVTRTLEKDELSVDAIELTQLLKAIGFKLQSFDFERSEKKFLETNNIEIEIRCKKSGIVSKLMLETEKCSCPLKSVATNNTFWQVSGTNPKSPGAKVLDSSSNLLQELMPQFTQSARSFVLIIFQILRSQNDLSKIIKFQTVPIIKQFVDILNQSMSGYMKNHYEALGLSPYKSRDPSPMNKTRVYDNLPSSMPKIFVNDISSIGDQSSLKSPASEPDGSEKLDGSKDILMIQSLTDARQKIDETLLMLKLNATNDSISKSGSNSVLTVTPNTSNIVTPLKTSSTDTEKSSSATDSVKSEEVVNAAAASKISCAVSNKSTAKYSNNVVSKVNTGLSRRVVDAKIAKKNASAAKQTLKFTTTTTCKENIEIARKTSYSVVSTVQGMGGSSVTPLNRIIKSPVTQTIVKRSCLPVSQLAKPICAASPILIENILNNNLTSSTPK